MPCTHAMPLQRTLQYIPIGLARSDVHLTTTQNPLLRVVQRAATLIQALVTHVTKELQQQAPVRPPHGVVIHDTALALVR